MPGQSRIASGVMPEATGGLGRAIGTDPVNQISNVRQGAVQDLIQQLQKDIAAGPSSQYAEDYMAHVPSLTDVMKNPQGMLYRRASPEAADILEGAGLGMKTPAGLQTAPGFGAKESLIGGRGGVMFPRQPGLPTDIYSSHAMQQQMTPMEILQMLRQLAQ